MKPVFFEDVQKALEAAYATGHNILLYGPPGHNKSNGAEWFLKQKGIKDIFIKSISSGTTIEDMYGGIDIKQIRDTGKMVFRLDEEDFFGNHEYVIFDEILDAKEKVLASLKDTLMAREVRNGKQRKTLKTKMIIGLTNVDAKDFEDNWERAAILERFPIRVLVKWDDYSPKAFEQLIQAVLTAEEAKKIAGFAKNVALHAATAYAEGGSVTPRAVIQACKAVVSTGVEDHGWLIVGSEGKGANIDDYPREIILKWRLQEIQAHVAELMRKKEFHRVDKVFGFLKLYSATADVLEKDILKPYIDELESNIIAKLSF